jgi:hypothetical protein
MRQIIILLAMLALTGSAYAGPAAGQLGAAVGSDAVSADVQAPPAPVDTKNIGCVENPMMPGCPKFCHTIGWGHPSCPPPLYCGTNPNGYGCPKSAGVESAESDAGLFDPGLAKANCAANPAAPGCPLFCKDHHAYPGCPMYCQLNPLSPACGHIPAYCGTNPNGYGCPKSVDKAAAGVAGEADEAGDMKKVTPGYPKPPHQQYCKDHHGLPSCR